MPPAYMFRTLASVAAFGALAAFAPAHAASTSIQIQINDPDGACESWTTGGTGSAPVLTCVKASGAPPAAGVPVCTITANNANPLNLSAAATVALNATCTNTDASTSWSWTGTGVVSPTTGSSPQQQSLNVSATTTFSVVATNASGPSASKSVAVNITPPAPPPPPSSTGSITCPGYANTIVMDFAWTPATQVLKAPSSAFGGGDIIVARFTTPANLARNGAYGFVGFGEYGGFSNERTVVLSTTACDMNPATPWPARQIGAQGNVAFNGVPGAGVALQPSTTYYFNITNMYYGTPVCGGNCPVGVTLKTN